MRAQRVPMLACLVLLGALLAGCGAEEAVPDPGPGAHPGAGGDPAAGDGASWEDEAEEVSLVGVIEPLGPSIFMQGSHQLVDGGRLLALLESRVVDLEAHEGRRVRVQGRARPTVEGGQQIVMVTEVEPL